MPRSYRHIEEYEAEILRMRAEGKTRGEISEQLGFTIKQVKNFVNRYNRRQDKLAAGMVIRRKGRPSKDTIVTDEMKTTELRYILARKEAKIKRLEMENELMRDFLSLTERK
jgi:transposase